MTKEIVLDFQRITQQIQVLERKKTSYLLESALKKEESVNEDLLELEEKYKVLQANTLVKHFHKYFIKFLNIF